MLSIQILEHTYAPSMEIPILNYRHWVDIYITYASVSMLSIQLLEHTYDPPMEIPIPELPSLGRHIYITDASVSMLSIQLLEHTYAPGMEIPIPELPSLGRHIYHWCVNLYAKHTIIVKQLWPRYRDSYTRITILMPTYISQMRQSQCWAYNNWNTPLSQVWRFLHPNYRHWIDMYITDASVSMLNIQLLQLTYVPGMELSIPELPSLGRHIYHRCLSLYAEHKIIGTPMSQVWRFLYPNYRHWVDMYITDTSGSRLRIKLLEHNYVPAMEIPIPELQSLARHIYRRRVSLCAEHTLI